MKTYSLYPVLRVDKPNKNGTCSLYIRYTYGKVWKNISLNKSLEPSYWNKEENEPRKNCPNRKEILDLIRRKKTEIETIVLELSREDGEYPSPEELINNISNGKNRNIKNWVYYFDLFVKNLPLDFVFRVFLVQDEHTQKVVPCFRLQVYQFQWHL